MAKKLTLNNLEIFLLPQKAVYIPHYAMLIVSDWHLGKLMHFRKEGLFVPPPLIRHELDILGELMQEVPTKKVVFLGDLFHSDWNADWTELINYLSNFPHIEFVLTKGNHDILTEEIWEKSTVIQQKDQLILAEGLVLSHEPIADLPEHMFNLVGHIHPGCVIETKGRQSFRLPCFYLKNKRLVLPAFGKYTGLHIISKEVDTQIFAIVNDAVIEV